MRIRLLLLRESTALNSKLGQDVRFNLVRVGQLVHLVEEPHNGQDLAQSFVIEAEFLDGGGVGVDAEAPLL